MQPNSKTRRDRDYRKVDPSRSPEARSKSKTRRHQRRLKGEVR